LERGRETATIERLMKRAHAGEGALLVIQGLAGAGKTALIRATVRRAMARGTLVL